MLKFVSWIDSLPGRFSSLERRRRKRAKSARKLDSRKPAAVVAATTTTTTTATTTTNIGARRHTVPDAFRGDSPLRALSPICAAAIETDPTSLRRSRGVAPPMTPPLTAATAAADDDDDLDKPPSRNCQTLSLNRSQIRTNPWVRPKSPRVPRLQLETSFASVDNNDVGRVRDSLTADDMYSSRTSSGYDSQDCSPASSVHTPDWQPSTSSELAPSREDIALQCDLTEDKATACTEEDFLILDANGNPRHSRIRMIDDDDDDNNNNNNNNNDDDANLADEDYSDNEPGHPVDDVIVEVTGHRGYRRRRRHDRVAPPSSASLFDYDDYETNDDDDDDDDDLGVGDVIGTEDDDEHVLQQLNDKLALLKLKSHLVRDAVRNAKQEKRERTRQRDAYQEQMRFLKQLKLVISSGFEVLV